MSEGEILFSSVFDKKHTMKKTLLILSIFLIFIIPKAKCQIEKDTAHYPYWIEMMQYDTVNFYSVQSAFNKYYAAHQDNDADI